MTLARILYEMSAETSDMTSSRASSGVPSAGSGQAHSATYCTLTLQARFWNSDFRSQIDDIEFKSSDYAICFLKFSVDLQSAIVPRVAHAFPQSRDGNS